MWLKSIVRRIRLGRKSHRFLVFILIGSWCLCYVCDLCSYSLLSSSSQGLRAPWCTQSCSRPSLKTTKIYWRRSGLTMSQPVRRGCRFVVFYVAYSAHSVIVPISSIWALRAANFLPLELCWIAQRLWTKGKEEVEFCIVCVRVCLFVRVCVCLCWRSLLNLCLLCIFRMIHTWIRVW